MDVRNVIMMPSKEDFEDRANPYAVRTDRPPEDNPAIGGDKTLVLPQITPYEVEYIDPTSMENMRISVERNFMSLSFVSRQIMIALSKIPPAVERYLQSRMDNTDSEIALLKERIRKLEEKF